MSEAIAFLGAAELTRRYMQGGLSPVEVTRALLERIARLDPELGAFTHVAAETALEAARRSERAWANGTPRGPLEGVPIGLKDLFDTADMPTEAGSRVFAGRRPAADARVVARLREAGAVLLGKLSLHELAFGITNVNPHLPPCRNPWDPERVPGGSSGGSAVALAAGLCPLALGTDTGGSIRIPAGACGVFGIKPTFGGVSRAGVVPLSWTLDHVGPMARSAGDATLLLDAIAGPDPADPWCVGLHDGPLFPRLRRDVAGVRLGVPETFLEGIEPEVRSAFDDSLRTLEKLGARRTVIALPPIENVYTATFATIAGEAASFHRGALSRQPLDFGEGVRRNLAIGLCLTAADLVAARRYQNLATTQILGSLESVDAIVLPTLPRTALRRDEPVSREPDEAWNRFCVPFNLSGVPAASMPCGFDSAGLPIGLQIAGRPFDEETVLRIATAFEIATPWHTRTPAVSLPKSG